MPNDPPSSRGDETPLERMMRFGTALFAVKKDEIPKRSDPKKPKRARKKATQ